MATKYCPGHIDDAGKAYNCEGCKLVATAASVLVVERSLPTGSSRRPDRYVAVVVVPQGVEFDPARTPINMKNLRAKGIEVTITGTGYAKNKGPKSALYAARIAARDLANTILAEQREAVA